MRCTLLRPFCTLAVVLLAAHPLRGQSSAVTDLPLSEFPALHDGSGTLVVFLTGDGGWAELDREVSKVLVDRGYPVVGLNMRKYLSHRRTPDEVGRDVSRLTRHYLTEWKAKRVAFIGYSRGADMLPFAANRLDADLRDRVALFAMFGLATRTAFEFHWTDILADITRPGDFPIAPELARMSYGRRVCVYGTLEKDSLCRATTLPAVERVERTGDHHFNREYAALGALIAGYLAS